MIRSGFPSISASPIISFKTTPCWSGGVSNRFAASFVSSSTHGVQTQSASRTLPKRRTRARLHTSFISALWRKPLSETTHTGLQLEVFQFGGRLVDRFQMFWIEFGRLLIEQSDCALNIGLILGGQDQSLQKQNTGDRELRTGDAALDFGTFITGINAVGFLEFLK